MLVGFCRTIARAAVAGLAVVTLAFILAPAAFAQGGGGKYLDAKYCGDQLNLNPGSTYADGACQLWRMVPAGGGWFRIQLKYNGKYLDADHCSDALNMNPGSDYAGGACQLWRMVPVGGGWSRLQLKYNGKYLDAKYCSDQLNMNPGSDYEGGARAVLDDERDVLGVAEDRDIGERVAPDDDEVGELALLDRAELGFLATAFGRPRRAGLDRLHRR
jgi:hypothetical protein